MTNQLVLVVWHDAWQDQDNFATQHGVTMSHQPMIVQTLGWLLVDDETGISIANEQSSEDGKSIYRGRTFIPREMVQSVTPFKMTKPRAPRIKREESVS